MEDVINVAPGIMIVDGIIRLCPGCGLKDLPGNRKETPDNVRAWTRGSVLALAEMGARECTLEAADAIAEAYIKSPWHTDSHRD